MVIFNFIAAAACSASASITKRAGADFTDPQGNYSTYDISVMNTGDCNLQGVQLQFSLPAEAVIVSKNVLSLFCFDLSKTQFWNLNNLGSGKWSLANFGDLLMQGSSFGYVLCLFFNSILIMK